MSTRAFLGTFAAVAVLSALVGAGCGSGDSSSQNAAPTEGTASTSSASAEAALDASRDAFAATESYRMRYEIGADGLDGTVEGEGAYVSDEVVYSRTTFVSDQLTEDDVSEMLFLPPDLYVQQDDGGWVVMSPWNQGIPPEEQEDLGLEEPIIGYADLAQDLYDIEQLPDEAIDGTEYQRFSATVHLDDLPSVAPEAGSRDTARADLWLAQDGSLPRKVRLDASGRDAFTLTMEFTDYDQPPTPPAPPANAQPYRDVQFPEAPCTGAELSDCLRAQNAIQGSGSCEGSGKRVCLVPLGQVSPGLIDHLVAHYRDQYDLNVMVLTPSAIPDGAADPLRDQVDAAALIDYMATLFPEAQLDPQAVLIGLTVADLYDSPSHFRYVFGLKYTPDHPKAVVSTFRMDPETYSEPYDEGLMYSRTRKLLSKYIGLLYYGLPTSSVPGDPMYDSILGPDDLDAMREPLPVE